MIRFVAEGARGRWTVEPNPSTRQWDVTCNGLGVATARSAVLGFGLARERSGYLAPEWHTEARCKVCDAWHDERAACGACEARRGRA